MGPCTAFRYWTRGIFFGLLVAGAAPAVAGEGAVLFVFDSSGSMWGQIDGTNKIVMARDVMADVVPQLPEAVDVGLIAYGHRRKDDCNDIELLAPVGTAREQVVSTVNNINPKGSTPLAGALAAAGDTLGKREGSSSIVLVSDGKESCDGDPCAAAKQLRESGIDVRVHVVGFDVGETEATQLRCIADDGGGRYWAAADATQLAAAFEEVRETVEKEALGAPEKPDTEATDVVFEDTFARSELGPDWQVLYENQSGWLLDEGYLVLTQRTEKRKIDGEERYITPNTLQLARELPEDFEIVTEWDVDFQPGKFWGQYIAIQLVSGKTYLQEGVRYGDFGSAGSSLYLADFFRKGEFGGGEPNEILKKGDTVGRELGSQKVLIKLVKNKFDFRAFTRLTGEKEWQETGSHKVLRFPDPRLQLTAGNYSEAPETTAHLRRVTIKRIE